MHSSQQGPVTSPLPFWWYVQAVRVAVICGARLIVNIAVAAAAGFAAVVDVATAASAASGCAVTATAATGEFTAVGCADAVVARAAAWM